jgi:hypothetical protein
MAKNNVDFKKALEKQLQAAHDFILAPTAVEMGQYARNNAHWKDHTHQLRDGIRGEPFYNPGESMGITLGHTMWYGIFIEKEHGPPNPDPKKRHTSEWWENWARASAEAVDYLENANDGTYAILKPTVEHFLPELKEKLAKHFGSIG